MNFRLPILLVTFIFGLILITFWSCQEDNFDTSSDVMLEFSLDSLRFDTVFTTVGSATRSIKAYNRGNRPIEIQKIYLDQGNNSKFRINVDGYSLSPNGTVMTNNNGNIQDTGEPLPSIPIAGNDSIYIFVEVTIDPDQDISASPFVLYEKLKFETNGNTQDVTLEAFGQNAVYVPSNSDARNINRLTCNMGIETWDDPRPYVIYGVLFVDSCELVIPAGTKIYVHGGIVNAGGGVFYNDGIWFFEPNSKLRMEGQLGNPIIIQGDRLEEPFQEVSGQWGGIRLGTGDNTHIIEHTIIKNSIVGVRVDSSATLEIKNSEIRNTSNSGLLGVHADITVQNSLFVDTGSNAVQLEYGGNYQFDYCTMANFGSDLAAFRATNALCLDELCSDCRENDLNATFRNCIITGSRNDEINFFNPVCSNGAFNVEFQNCVIKISDLLEDYPDFFTSNCIPGTCYNLPADQNLFFDDFEGDYHLDTLSFAEQKGMPIIGINEDIEGTSRDANMPDIGCYEYVY